MGKEIPKDWKAYNVRGLREATRKNIEGDAGLPPVVKQIICSEIDGLPDNCLGVSVDCYGVSLDGQHALARTICISVVGLKL
jgi:hypothetical protein